MSSTAENKRRFIRLSSKFYYKSGQWSADFITVVRVHKPSSCPTYYTFCFSYRFLGKGQLRTSSHSFFYLFFSNLQIWEFYSYEGNFDGACSTHYIAGILSTTFHYSEICKSRRPDTLKVRMNHNQLQSFLKASLRRTHIDLQNPVLSKF